LFETAFNSAPGRFGFFAQGQMSIQIIFSLADQTKNNSGFCSTMFPDGLEQTGKQPAGPFPLRKRFSLSP